MAVTFSFLGHALIIPDDRVRYNELRQQYRKLAEKQAGAFAKLYDNKYRSLDDVSKHAFEDGVKLIGEALEVAMRDLLQHGAYHISEEVFVTEYYQPYLRWDQDFDKVNEQYLEIVLSAEQLDEYRRQRRQSRGRVVGGGFGLEGAVKGMATAGAINLAFGAAHATFNGVAKLISLGADSWKKSKIFNDPETRFTLMQGVYNAVLSLHFALIGALREHTAVNITGYVTSEQSAKAQSILDNVERGFVDGELVPQLLREAISLDPYNTEIYECAVSKFGDRDGAVSELAAYFGINLDHFKQSVLKELGSKLSTRSEQETLSAKEEMLEAAKFLGADAGNYIAHYDELLTEFDLRMRTVEDMVFATREEAAVARQELADLQKYIKEGDRYSLEGVRAILQRIEERNLQTGIGRKYIEELQKKEQEYDEKARTVDGVLFATEEEAKRARQELETITAVLKSGSKRNEDDVNRMLSELKSQNWETFLVDKYLSDLEERSAKFDLQARTVDGHTYTTREEADQARKEWEEIKEILRQGNRRTEEGVTQLIAAIETRQFKTEVLREKYLGELRELRSKIQADLAKKAEDMQKRALRYQEKRSRSLGKKVGSAVGWTLGGIVVMTIFPSLAWLVLGVWLGLCINNIMERKAWQELTANGQTELVTETVGEEVITIEEE